MGGDDSAGPGLRVLAEDLDVGPCSGSIPMGEDYRTLLCGFHSPHQKETYFPQDPNKFYAKNGH